MIKGIEFFRKYMPVTLAIFIVVIICSTVIIFFTKDHNYDKQGANIKNFDTISTFISPFDGAVFRQVFISKNNNLDKIIFYFKNNKNVNRLKLSLIDEQNNLVRSENFVIKISDNYQILTWDFDNITNSRNKKYSLLISPKNRGFAIATTPANRYEFGKLFNNGTVIKDKILAFSFCYYEDNLFPIFKKRITVYKPGIFQIAWSFIILFVIIIILVYYMVYLLTKEILS